MRPEREVLGSQRCASSRAVYPKEFTLESPCGARMSAFTLQMKHQAESAQEEGVLERISSRRGGREHPDAASSPKMGPRGDDFRCRESRASAAVTRDGLLPNQRCPSTKSMTGTYGSRSPLRSAPHFRKQKKKKKKKKNSGIVENAARRVPAWMWGCSCAAGLSSAAHPPVRAPPGEKNAFCGDGLFSVCGAVSDRCRARARCPARCSCRFSRGFRRGATRISVRLNPD